MSLRIESVSVDTTDPSRLAPFWEAALGWTRSEPSDDDEVILEAPVGTTAPELLFLRVPEDKAVKNRLHLDLRPSDDQDAEVGRLLDLGARRVDVGQKNVSWVVLADPDGNEFCVLSVAPVAVEPSRPEDRA